MAVAQGFGPVAGGISASRALGRSAIRSGARAAEPVPTDGCTHAYAAVRLRPAVRIAPRWSTA